MRESKVAPDFNSLFGTDMSFSDLGVELSRVSLDGLSGSEWMDSGSANTPASNEQQLLLVQSPSKQYLVLKPEDFKAVGNGYQVVCYADTSKRVLNKPNGEFLSPLPAKGIEVFMEAMVKVLSLNTQPNGVRATGSGGKAKKAVSSQIMEPRGDLTRAEAQAAFRKALQMVSKNMGVHIDFWTAEAGSRLVKAASFKTASQADRARSDARYLQGTAAELAKCFHARLNECLREGRQQEQKPSENLDLSAFNLSVAENEEWHRETAIRTLTASVKGQSQLEFSHVNRRLSFLLNRRVKPEQNVIGPEMLSRCLCAALSDVSYSKDQINALYEVVSDYYASALGKIYHDINSAWIDVGIIPEIKLRVWRDEYQPRTRSRSFR